MGLGEIVLEDVRFRYPASAGEGFELRVDELEIAAGERVACIGPSGSGKTTLLGLIAGILVPHEGRVVVGGTEVSALGDARRRRVRIGNIGMVFQEFELLEYVSALENILVPIRVSAGRRVVAADRQRANGLAASLGVSHVLGRKPTRLSQGERQRIAICRCLVTDPGIIMGDEPTGNLDPATGETTLDLLFEQAASRGASVVIVTHNHGILDRFDRVIDVRSLHGDGLG